MDNLTEEELATALIEVRRSYRVVVAYQRRINEIFYRFHLAMGDAGLGFQRWEPGKYSAPMAYDNVQFAPAKWVWDLFPGFSFSAAWQRSGPPTTRVWLGVETDTGWKKKGTVEPDPRDFAPVGDEHTEIWVGLYQCDQGVPNWNQLWKEKISAAWEESQDVDRPWEFRGLTGVYQCRCVRVQRLTTREAVEDHLIRPTLEWLKSTDGGAHE